MKIKEFEGVLHTPRKLDQIIRNGKETPQTLPPRCAMSAYPVDSYPACPESWMNGSDIAGSYFVGVEEDKGMWLDFNPCCNLDRDVAIVISIQGVNPITGKKTDALRLEQYKSKCPVHDVPFQQDNYCPECEFDWPDQNYLATTGTPLGNLWLDGFRRPDGTVRQYIFTAEEMKGIASQIIGKDKVYAIGIAFYYSKDKKPIANSRESFRSGNVTVINTEHFPKSKTMDMIFGGSDMIIGGDVSDDYPVDDECLDFYEDNLDSCTIESENYSCDNIKINYKYMAGPCGSAGNGSTAGGSAEMGSTTSGSLCGGGQSEGFTSSTGRGLNRRKGVLRSQSTGGIVTPESANGNKCLVANSVPRATVSSNVKPVKPTKKLEIGAGALINQKVYRDTKTIDYWEEEPAGMLYINYCDMTTLNDILEAGKIKKKSEGFMDKLTVGS